MSRDVLISMIFKIDFEHVDILIKCLVYYSLINYFYKKSFFEDQNLQRYFIN